MYGLEHYLRKEEDEEKVYSVAEITRYIRKKFDDPLFYNVWISGEISNWQVRKPHIYFYLKEERNNMVYMIKAVYFSSARQYGDKFRDGDAVLVRGEITIYEGSSMYEIKVREMKKQGEGELYRRYLALKEKLEKEGLFSEEHKKPRPQFPRVIGVVTSMEADALRDIIKTIRSRYPYVRIILSPSSVQGRNAPDEIARAIRYLNEYSDTVEKIDVIIVARGGGSFEDLFAFNEETTVRAIYESKIPVITGIGHQRDYTLSDFAADHRSPTPTAAAADAVPDAGALRDTIDGYAAHLYMHMTAILSGIEERSNSILSWHIERPLVNMMDYYTQAVDSTFEAIESRIDRIIEIMDKNIEKYTSDVENLSPLNTLKRGYATVLHDGRMVSSVDTLSPGMRVDLVFRDGKALGDIVEVERDVKEVDFNAGSQGDYKRT